MIAVADASPLIFLGKVEQLGLIPNLLTGDLLVPVKIVEEILSPRISPAEERRLRAFLDRHCQVVKVNQPRSFTAALSQTDSAVLTLALRKNADHLLTDDRLIREIAMTEGLRPLGTLGVLLRAIHQRQLTSKEVRSIVDTLIREHCFRISIEVYEAMLRQIAAGGDGDQ